MKEGVVAVVVLLCGRSGSGQRRLYRDEAGEQIGSVEGAARVGLHFWAMAIYSGKASLCRRQFGSFFLLE